MIKTNLLGGTKSMGEVIHDFTITKENRGAIGFTEDTEDLIIPEIFVGDGNNGTVKGEKYRVTKIRTGSFRHTKLKSVTIPSSTQYISDESFWGCSHLQAIFVDSKNPRYQTICNHQLLLAENKRIVFIVETATELVFTQNISQFTCFYYLQQLIPNLKTVFIPDSCFFIEPDFSEYFHNINIVINQPKGAISDAPWGADDAHIYWIG